MGIPGAANPLLMRRAAAAATDDGYQIKHGLRFDEDSDANLKKTIAADGNRLQWTYSCWLKNCLDNGGWWLFGKGNSYFQVVVDGTESWIRCNQRTNGGNTWWDSGRKINDPGAWYHIVIALDYTQTTNADKIKLYINGVLDPAGAGQLGKNYVSTNTELLINQAGDHYIGSNSNPDGGCGYLADVYFIDGQQLSPAAFGSFDSTGVWTPSSFSIPAPNNGTTWSNDGDATNMNSSYPWSKAFDGVADGTYGNGAGADDGDGWARWTPTDGITVKASLRLNTDNGTTSAVKVKFSSGENTSVQHLKELTDGWNDVEGSGVLEYIEIYNSGSEWSYLCGVEIDGVVLRDGTTDPATRNNPNDGRTWSSTVASGFNGNPNDNYLTTSSDTITVTFSPGILYNELRFASDSGAGTSSADMQYSINGGTLTNFIGAGVEKAVYASGSNTLTSFAIKNTTATNCRWNYLKVDGHHLINGATDNSFGLNFSDVSSSSALGKDTLNGKIADATGGLPIYKTSDDYGEVKGSGYRADSSAGTTDGTGLVLAIPGDTFTDYASFADSHVDDAATAFDGSLTGTYATAGGGTTGTFTFTGSKFTGITKLRIYGRYDSRDNAADSKILVNDEDIQVGSSAAWVTATEHLNSGALNTLKIVSNSYNTALYAIEIDDVVVTTGDDLDVHASINTGSSAKTVASDGVAISTVQSRFYGSSLLFEASNTDSLKVTGDADVAFGTGDFCVEFWVYNTNNKNYNAFVATRSGGSTEDGWVIASNSSGYLYVHSNAAVAGSYSGEHVLPLNQWCHVAYTRTSGTHRLFLNGIAAANASTTSRDYTNDDLAIGTNPYDSEEIDSYVNDIRIYKGVAVYSSNFKPPTLRNNWSANNLTETDGVVKKANADSKPILGTSDDFGKTYSSGYETDSNSSSLVLAISGKTLADNHADIKGSGTNHSISNSSSTTSTSRSKFYGTAIATDGGSQHFVVADSSDFEFGSGEFTIEYWINAEDVANDGLAAWLMKGTNSSNNSFDWRAYSSSDGSNRNIYCDFMTSDGAKYMGENVNNMPNDEWVHFAVVRDNTDNKFYLYKNGVKIDDASVASGATIDDDYSDGLTWGYFNAISGSNHYGFEGWVNDIRIYKGFCKYPGGTTFNVVTEGAPAELDVFTDTPTNYTDSSDVVHGNYCTLNPLTQANNSGTQTFKHGNLHHESTSSAGAWHMFRGTMTIPKGSTDKFYYEVEWVQDTGNTDFQVGWVDPFQKGVTASGFGDSAHEYCFRGDNGKFFSANVQHTYGSAPSQGDIVGVGYDNGSIRFWVNGTEQNSGTAATTGVSKPLMPGFATYTQSNDTFKANFNFGQRDFKHPQSGYKSICTQNLDDTFSGAAVNNPSKFFDIKTWAGTGSAGHDIKGFNFQPDMVWLKRRDTLGGHHVRDAIRGATKSWFPNTNEGEGTDSNIMSAFISDGFTLGNGDNTNNSSGTYVGWAWDVGTAAATASTAGSVTPSAQWVNATAGISITTWAGDDTNPYTVGHGLSAKPDFIIIKRYTTGSSSNFVYHSSLGAEKYIQLDADSAAGDDTGLWNDTEPDSQKFTVGSWNMMDSGQSLIAYCWNAVPGYSAFGQATGNGSTNGVFVYTGFKPRWILWKGTNEASSWGIIDTARSPYNVADDLLTAEANSAEDTGNSNWARDILSNGFKMRGSHGAVNGSGDNYIWAAFAEHPQKTARAS